MRWRSPPERLNAETSIMFMVSGTGRIMSHLPKTWKVQEGGSW